MKTINCILWLDYNSNRKTNNNEYIIGSTLVWVYDNVLKVIYNYSNFEKYVYKWIFKSFEYSIKTKNKYNNNIQKSSSLPFCNIVVFVSYFIDFCLQTLFIWQNFFVFLELFSQHFSLKAIFILTVPTRVRILLNLFRYFDTKRKHYTVSYKKKNA